MSVNMNRQQTRTAQRGQIIGMRENGLSIRDIAAELGISKNTVSLWLSRWDKRGNLCDLPRGRPSRRTTPEQDQQIWETADDNTFTNAVAIREQLALAVTPRTVRRRLHEAGLKTYSLMHKGLIGYVCNDCGKTFSQKGHLKQHSSIHSRIKEHVCNDCGKAFTRKESLKAHSLIHIRENEASTEYPLTFRVDNLMRCNECGECFFDKNLLIDHISGHEPTQSCSNENKIDVCLMEEKKYQSEVDQRPREDVNQKSLISEDRNARVFSVDLNLKKDNYDQVIKEKNEIDDDNYDDDLRITPDVKTEDDCYDNVIKEEIEIDDYSYDESLRVTLDVKKEDDCYDNVIEEEHEVYLISDDIKEEN